MKTVTIPFLITTDEQTEELFSARILEMLIGLKTKRVSLVFGNRWLDTEWTFPIVKKAVAYFKEYGIEVAVWLNSLLHIPHNGNYVKRKHADGTESSVCPLDKNFISDFAVNVAKYAETGVPLIYLDDDFRMGVSGTLNCFCDLHMKEYEKILGENITREKMASEILSGKPNVYRDAWSRVNGDVLRNAARVVREEADKINPKVRVGLCAAPTTVSGLDGVTAYELSNILAGNTEPFLRTIGAPYWSYYANDGFMARLNDVIGLERLQANYAEQFGFNGELIAEGDTYPRPRYATPAAYLEMFHSAMCTENRMNGILKYLGEYTCKGTRETGYSKAALKKADKREKVEQIFYDTQKTGYRIFEYQDKSRAMEIPPQDVEGMDYQCTILHASIRALNDASIPYTFSGKEPVVAFGDNAIYLTDDDIKQGVFTDIIGAKILKDKGFDVGFDSCDRLLTVKEISEIYPAFNDSEYVNFKRKIDLFDIDLKNQAKVLTYTSVNSNKIPLTYRYEKDGFKIAVCCVNMIDARFSYGFFKSYYKQRVLADCYRYFKGENLAAVCFDCPMLMPIVGKKGGKTIVGLWNIFEDEVSGQEIKLSKAYKRAEFIGCSGKLKDNSIILDSLGAFDYCAVVLYE